MYIWAQPNTDLRPALMYQCTLRSSVFSQTGPLLTIISSIHFLPLLGSSRCGSKFSNVIPRHLSPRGSLVHPGESRDVGSLDEIYNLSSVESPTGWMCLQHLQCEVFSWHLIRQRSGVYLPQLHILSLN